MHALSSIEIGSLAVVTGGLAPSGAAATLPAPATATAAPPSGYDSSFGRCGPGAGWSFLGDVRTPECAAHDRSVRDAQAHGASKVWSHLQALPRLPAAIGSYVRSVFS